MGNKRKKWAANRDKRRTPKGPDTNSKKNRERNIGHKNAEEHNRTSKRK